MKGGIKQWPEEDRPREKLIKRGPESLTDAELLAIILRTGDSSTGKSAMDISRELCAAFNGNLRKLADATVTELCAIKGTGPAKAATVKAALALARRLGDDRLRANERFTTPEQVYRHYRSKLEGLRKEYFLILLLDGKNRVIREVEISVGSLNQSLVHPREVFSPAVRESAAAIILIHNHPTGDPTPSREDIDITRRLKEAGELMGIRILDHVIVGTDRFVSLVDQGLM
jgi:DNA repair protein RadC